MQKKWWQINIDKGVYIRTKHDKILYCLSMNIKVFLFVNSFYGIHAIKHKKLFYFLFPSLFLYFSRNPNTHLLKARFLKATQNQFRLKWK